MRRLCDFLRTHQAEIIADWSQRVRSLSAARELSQSAIIDHLPQILTRIAEIVETVHTGGSASLEEGPRKHALDRLHRGFDLDQLVTEYGLLRRAILDLWELKIGPTLEVAELRHLDAAFDESIAQSAKRYALARERLLQALNRVSEAALGSSDIDAFLEGLLRATLQGTESVDSCIVMLREGEFLRVRAAVGLEEELGRTYSLQIGEGFAGRIAREGRPMMLRHAAEDPLVHSPVIRASGMRALYGVPMMQEDNVIGVAHIGSLQAFEFSDEDQLLFRTVVSRATAGIIRAHLLADLQRAVTAREQVLAVVSHDLRNQLATIAGPAELLARKIDQLDPAAIQKFAHRIRPAVTTMQSLLDDLLDMAAIQSGQVSVDPQPVALTPLLGQACESHEAAARAKGLTLKWEPAAAGVCVHADRKRILQVIDNLIANAIKFTSPGGMISLRAEMERTLVIVSIADTGVGIAQEELAAIFEPYRVIARSAGTGTGLGLYIAQGIVTRHGGRIWAASEPGKGSTFSFTLPRVDDTQTLSRSAPTSSQSATRSRD